MTTFYSPTSAVTAVARDLETRIRGSVIVPADPAYLQATRLWNGAVQRTPALIVRARDEVDVMTAVRAAQDSQLPLSIRGGGHDWAGRALRDGGLVLDLSEMRHVAVDPVTWTAVAQGGTRNGDIAQAAHRHEFVAVTGTVNAVGLTGLTLGGGYGLLAGSFGLAADNLLSARVVVADGRLVTASPDENPDLYWALRGGGGNFGVVVAGRYRLHPVRSALSGLLLYPHAQASRVLRGYRDLLAQAPDELTVMAGFFGGPDGRPVLFLLPLWVGERARGEQWFDRLRGLGSPMSSQLGVMAYRDVLSQFDQTVVDGRHLEVRTRWLPVLDDDSLAALVDAADGWTSGMSGIYVHHFHGAASRVPVEETAFGLRRDHLLVEMVASWDATDRNGGRHRDWVRALSQRLASQALPGGYPNLLDEDEYERVLLAYGPNVARLLALKHRFDPQGLFRAVPGLSPASF